MTPYSNATFFGFLWTFVQRMALFATGGISFGELATDEIQVLVLAGVALSGALVGTWMVLRRMSMLANSLSHTILVGIVLVYAAFREGFFAYGGALSLEALLIAALLMGIVTAFLTQTLTNTLKLQEDASIGLVFTSLFALGVVLVTYLTRDAHIGIEIVMGNVDALHRDDLKLVFIIALLNLALVTLFYKQYLVTTFDRGLAAALGISALLFDYILMVQASATCVAGFRAVGVLMILALLTGPPLAARFLTDSVPKMMALAALIGAAASLFGVALSRHILTTAGIALSTGGLVVCLLILFFIAAALIPKLWRKSALSF